MATTHLSSPPYLRDSFIAELDELVDGGVVTQEQRDEIVAKIDRKRIRNFEEADRIVEQFEKHRNKSKDPNQYRHLILGGDFNTEPDTLTITALRKVGFTNATAGPDFLTWDPVKNAENQSIAGRLTPPVPTFDIPEIEALLEPWEHIPRQIDFIFVGPSVTPVSAEMVLDEPRDGIYPSDHFGMLSVVRLGRTEN